MEQGRLGRIIAESIAKEEQPPCLQMNFGRGCNATGDASNTGLRASKRLVFKDMFLDLYLLELDGSLCTMGRLLLFADTKQPYLIGGA